MNETKDAGWLAMVLGYKETPEVVPLICSCRVACQEWKLDCLLTSKRRALWVQYSRPIGIRCSCAYLFLHDRGARIWPIGSAGKLIRCCFLSVGIADLAQIDLFATRTGTK